MKKAQIDVAVLLLFFARPEQTAKVFEQIRIARPTKLFLYQDGPREGREDDILGIKACRKIVEDIDWECDVYRLYQERNVGCDPSEYLSQKWMFSIVDKGIILEDDDVPSQSFFPFCKELLDKYEFDNRIGIICGMNHLDKVDIDADYFFCQNRGPIWGWATWKRFIDKWDPTYKFMDNQRDVKNLMLSGDLWKSRLETYRRHKAKGIEFYEDFVSSTLIFNHMMAIIPSKNLISNIGIAAESTHFSSNLKNLPPKFRKLLFKPTFEYTFPLKHPTNMVHDEEMTRAIAESMRAGIYEKSYILIRRIINKLYKILR